MSESLCRSDALAEGDSRAFHTARGRILVFRLSDGVFATGARCTHLFWPLTGGAIQEDRCVRCPFHHARFDIRSGEVLQWASRPPGIGALNPLRPPQALPTYRVSERDGEIYLED